MNIEILASAPPQVLIHLIAALFCTLLGGYILYAKKGPGAHKVMGWMWVASMVVALISALFIHGFRWIGPFSPIHLIIPFSAYGLWRGICAIRKKQVGRHRKAMLSIYWGALGIPFALALLPGRRLNTMLFANEGNMTPTIVLALILTGVGAYLLWGQKLKRTFQCRKIW